MVKPDENQSAENVVEESVPEEQLLSFEERLTEVFSGSMCLDCYEEELSAEAKQAKPEADSRSENDLS